MNVHRAGTRRMAEALDSLISWLEVSVWASLALALVWLFVSLIFSI